MRVCRTILPIAILCLPWARLQSQNSVGTLVKGDAELKGWIMPAGDLRVLSGATIKAGREPAVLHLNRGGEVRVCPGGSLSVSASPDGRELMMAIGAGGIEVNYSSTKSADTVLTPDFQILLAGPGGFHFAIASDADGTACMRALAANKAGLVVTESMGGGNYQVLPDEQVRFLHGSIKEVEAAGPLDCGCLQQLPRLSADGAITPAPIAPPSSAPDVVRPATGIAAIPSAASSATAAPPPVAPGELQVTVDAPFVFRAAEMSIPAAPAVVRLHLESLPPLALLVPPQVLAPPASTPHQTSVAQVDGNKDKPKGFLSRLRSFFAAIWGLRTT